MSKEEFEEKYRALQLAKTLMVHLNLEIDGCVNLISMAEAKCKLHSTNVGFATQYPDKKAEEEKQLEGAKATLAYYHEYRQSCLAKLKTVEAERDRLDQELSVGRIR